MCVCERECVLNKHNDDCALHFSTHYCAAVSSSIARLIGSSSYRKPAEGQARVEMKPSLSNCDEVPEVRTRLTKLHIPSADLSTLTTSSAHRVLRHRGFVGTNEMREVFLYLKSL